MKSLAHFSVRHRWWVLGAWIIVFFLINGVSHAEGSAYSNAFSLPGTNSTMGQSLLQKGFADQSSAADPIVFQSPG